ncbi:hypothetical protein OG331_47825 [Streptomyces sp. NBC_01017]|uniref:hypothetical protein n=1 Tax=Streptomyces sp. NBC_01017 TaxID=2903721 RepID=UPI0038632BCC|nr:hypothetical protein OG331_04155 [Streptomyces sp. NBC_01017]WSV34771.1 hypothetical protein OG331_47825 [Streptomyces sp. NBC_01017]
MKLGHTPVTDEEVAEMEASQPLTKPERPYSPPEMVIDGVVWTNHSMSKALSVYKAPGKTFHITVENKSGKAHASPEESAGALFGTALHVYASGPVDNWVAAGLQGEVAYWLGGGREDSMRQICAEFKKQWPDAMENMETAYATAKQQYLISKSKAEANRPGLSREEADAIARMEARKRRKLAHRLERAIPVRIEIDPELQGVWLVQPGGESADLYALPTAFFHPAKTFKGLWTEQALGMASPGGFFLAAREDGRLYICATRRLADRYKVDQDFRALMKLPEAQISNGLLRAGNGSYRVSPEKIQKILKLAPARFDAKRPGGWYRVDTDGRSVPVRPEDPELGLFSVEKWKTWLNDLPEGVFKDSVVTVTTEGGKEQRYLWQGTWPAEPEFGAEGKYHKILASDGVFVVSLTDRRYFLPMKPGVDPFTMWKSSLPEMKGKLHKYGTLVLRAGGLVYIVKRNEHEEFLAAAAARMGEIKINTPGCFTYAPGSKLGPGRKKMIIDPAAHSELMTEQKWKDITAGVAEAKFDEVAGVISFLDNGVYCTMSVIKMPEKNCSSRQTESYKLKTADGEILLVSVTSQGDSFGSWEPRRTKEHEDWMWSLPWGSYNQDTHEAIADFGSGEQRYRMTVYTWNSIALNRKIGVTSEPEGTFFMLALDGDIKNGHMGPFDSGWPQLVPADEWDAWVAGMPAAEFLTDVDGDPVFVFGYGPQTRVFRFFETDYKEPQVGTAGCILLWLDDEEEMVPVLAKGLDDYDVNAKNLERLIGQEAYAEVADRLAWLYPGQEDYLEELEAGGAEVPRLLHDGDGLTLHNETMLAKAPLSAVDGTGAAAGADFVYAYFTGQTLILWGTSSAQFYSQQQQEDLAWDRGWTQILIFKIKDECVSGYRLQVCGLAEEYEEAFREYMILFGHNDVPVNFVREY